MSSGAPELLLSEISVLFYYSAMLCYAMLFYSILPHSTLFLHSIPFRSVPFHILYSLPVSLTLLFSLKKQKISHCVLSYAPWETICSSVSQEELSFSNQN